MAVTIRDVARASGVHVYTVSRTFSAPHLVNPETRTRVLAAAEELGYLPNRAARALTTGRTHNLGLIVPDISNPFYPPIIKAAQAHARERDYHVFVADTDEDPKVEEDLIQAMAKQVDGMLLCSPRLSNRAVDRFRHELPFVVINRRIRGLPAVLMDVGAGARQAIQHLTGLGHRRLAFVSGPEGSWNSKHIREEIREADLEADVSVIGPNSPTVQGGRLAAPEVLRSEATAVLAYNDLVAIGLIEGLDELSVQVPADISVVGIDDIGEARLTRPRLTTLAMPTVAAGRSAVDMLLQMAGDRQQGPPAMISLPTTLIVRESTAAPVALPREVK